MIKHILSKIPMNMKITLTCVLGLIVCGALFYPLIPILLNYPPNSINNAFQIRVNSFYYTTQYLTVISFMILTFIIFLPILLKRVNTFDKLNYSNLENNKNLSNIIKLCFNFPILLLFLVLILPTILVLIVLVLLKQELFFSLKITFIIFSMASLLSLLIYSFTKFLFEDIIKKTFIILSKETIHTKKKKTQTKNLIKNKKKKIKITHKLYGIRINTRNKLLVQLFTLLLFTIIFSFLILYSEVTKLKGDSLYSSYKQSLDNIINNKNYSSIEELKTNLSNIPLKSNNDSIFIIKANGDLYYSKDTLSDFFTSYLFEFESISNGRTYDYYGTPIQGAFSRITIQDTEWIVGIKFSVFTDDIIKSILPLYLIVILVNIFFITTIATNYRNELKVLANSLSKISKNNTKYLSSRLYVFSNDEIGDLTIAFNEIQELTQNHIKQIHDNQDTLMEKERLASLGQLIGGIAHNLKTPIMSISGATEGLSDLIKEYDSCIEDPEVNFQDHHEIASDMFKWIEKIRNYTEYMSDVITAVKGQAVALSEENKISFSLTELIKRVDILMKHELKNALIYLKVKMKTDEHQILNGDVNALVQIINNMISNSIQAYNGKPNQDIDMTLETKDNQLIISITDYASGMPENVKEKLFKEMVTTKGKNGTGLGLYMSYSTIKAHFNGTITVESEEGKGTTFSIVLPLSNKD